MFNPTYGLRRDDGAGHSGPALFLFASEAGHITGWSPAVPPAGTVAERPDVVHDARRRGLQGPGDGVRASAGRSCTRPTSTTARSTSSTRRSRRRRRRAAFTDPNIPAGFAPFGIQAIDGKLYVSPTPSRTPTSTTTSAGPGNGFVDVFDPNGTLVTRLVSQRRAELAVGPGHGAAAASAAFSRRAAGRQLRRRRASTPTTRRPANFLGTLQQPDGPIVDRRPVGPALRQRRHRRLPRRCCSARGSTVRITACWER